MRVGGRLAALAFVASLAGCAPRELRLPAGPSAPLADTAPMLRDALGHCAGLRSITAEIGLSGHAGTTKLRGRIQAGFARPERLRLEGVAPFGAPVFVLAGTAERTTLWLPRDARVLRDTAAADIVDSLVGFAAAPDDLAAWLEGCPAARFEGAGGQAFGAAWARVADGDRSAWFQKTDRWRLVQTEREGLAVEFSNHTGVQPARIRIRRAASTDRGALDIGLSISQVETNVTLPQAAFTVEVPADAAPIGLDELRQSGPLRETPRGTR